MMRQALIGLLTNLLLVAVNVGLAIWIYPSWVYNFNIAAAGFCLAMAFVYMAELFKLTKGR